MATSRSFEELLQAIREEAIGVIGEEDVERWLISANFSFAGRSPADILREEGEAGYERIHSILRLPRGHL